LLFVAGALTPAACGTSPESFFTEDNEENKDLEVFNKANQANSSASLLITFCYSLFYIETSASSLRAVWFAPGRIIRKIPFLRTSS
jgi:hypothetical protein